MIFESFNVTAAEAALSSPFVSRRNAVSVRPDSEIFRFVADTVPMSFNGWNFEEIAFAEFANINSGDGSVADTTSITLDGSHIVTELPDTPDSILQSVLQYNLRDRPIQISTIVLDGTIAQPIGLIPEFVGFIDSVEFSRSINRNSGSGRLKINIVSFRAFAKRRVPRTYANTDHMQRFPDDMSLRWLSENVFRSGKFAWNKDAGTGSGSGAASGGFGGGGNRFNNGLSLR